MAYNDLLNLLLQRELDQARLSGAYLTDPQELKQPSYPKRPLPEGVEQPWLLEDKPVPPVAQPPLFATDPLALKPDILQTEGAFKWDGTQEKFASQNAVPQAVKTNQPAQPNTFVNDIAGSRPGGQPITRGLQIDWDKTQQPMEVWGSAPTSEAPRTQNYADWVQTKADVNKKPQTTTTQSTTTNPTTKTYGG